MSQKYKLGETSDIEVHRNEANLDRACDEAYRAALFRFDVDEDGHINAVEGAERSEHSIHVEFVGYSLISGVAGHEHNYRFTACVCDEGGDT